MGKLLPEICRIQYGYAFDSAKFSDSEGVPLIRIRDVVRGFSETYTTEECVEEYIVNDGDMLIGMDGEFNIAHWKGGKAYLNQRVCRLIPTNEVDALYLYYFMPKALKAIEDKTPFVTVKHLSAKELNQVIVPIPSMEEQMKIANSLKKVDELIALRKEQIVKLDQLVKSRFIELFGDDVPTAKLGDVCRMINGDRGKNYPSGDDFVENGVPFVNAGHLQNRKVDFCDMNYITEEKFNLLSQGKMQEGDILYCLRGSLGKHGLVDFERGAVASSLVILRCNQEQVLPQFLLYALETPEIELQLKAANNGSSQPNLSAASVKAYDIKLPTIEQQKQFVSFVEQTDKSELTIQQSLDKLETLKKALMQKYFG